MRTQLGIFLDRLTAAAVPAAAPAAARPPRRAPAEPAPAHRTRPRPRPAPAATPSAVCTSAVTDARALPSRRRTRLREGRGEVRSAGDSALAHGADAVVLGGRIGQRGARPPPGCGPAPWPGRGPGPRPPAGRWPTSARPRRSEAATPNEAVVRSRVPPSSIAVVASRARARSAQAWAAAASACGKSATNSSPAVAGDGVTPPLLDVQQPGHLPQHGVAGRRGRAGRSAA